MGHSDIKGIVNDFLQKLDIDKEPEKDSEGSYVIEFDDSDELSKVWSKLRRSKIAEPISSATKILEDGSTYFQFYNDKLHITLMDDAENDQCTMVIRQI